MPTFVRNMGDALPWAKKGPPLVGNLTDPVCSNVTSPVPGSREMLMITSTGTPLGVVVCPVTDGTFHNMEAVVAAVAVIQRDQGLETTPMMADDLRCLWQRRIQALGCVVSRLFVRDGASTSVAASVCCASTNVEARHNRESKRGHFTALVWCCGSAGRTSESERVIESESVIVESSFVLLLFSAVLTVIDAVEKTCPTVGCRLGSLYVRQLDGREKEATALKSLLC